VMCTSESMLYSASPPFVWLELNSFGDYSHRELWAKLTLYVYPTLRDSRWSFAGAS
jgi:hypothetical protein